MPEETAHTSENKDFIIENGVLVNSDDNLTSAVIPDGVIRIGGNGFKGAFTNNKNLSSVVIPDSVQEIDKNAFRCCSGLTSVKIPNGVKRIGKGAFANCDGLTSIELLGGERLRKRLSAAALG